MSNLTKHTHQNHDSLPAAGSVSTRVTLSPIIAPAPERTIEQLAKEKRAEDIAYTVNHAVSCAALDLFGGSPIGSKLSSEYVVPGIQKGMKQVPFLRRFSDVEIHPWCSHPIGKWTVAEIAGDIGSVLPTIALQHYAPGVFSGMQGILEPTLGWAYKSGARRGAARWAREHDLDYNDPRVEQYQHALYQHEVEHLPHAFIWGAVSLPISGAILSFTGHNPDECGHDHGHGHSHGHSHSHSQGHTGCGHGHGHSHAGAKPSNWRLLRGNMLHVLGGKIFSSAVLLGLRSIAPDKARDWDRWASDTVYSPVTKSIGGLMGVDAETIERVRNQHYEMSNPNHAPNLKVQTPAQEHQLMVDAEPDKMAVRG